jgi:hypothetical protein
LSNERTRVSRSIDNIERVYTYEIYLTAFFLQITDRLEVVENSLKHANETIKVRIIIYFSFILFRFFVSQNYETDIDRLRQALNLSQEKNEQLEREISHAYIDELNMKNDRLRVYYKYHR